MNKEEFEKKFNLTFEYRPMEMRDINNKCLNKAKVRKAIDTFMKTMNVPEDADIPIDVLLKESGIEDE